ncbi:helix-turn-helix domain-containing protein [Alicyclobacillus pomorum]|uniref:helix-turn-helix domain-containing protein n=1 Tax=Alicyclobacillus pomorum TaxID=204470 RepID=UPI000420B125|nr:XRE family transcriptional regulator [Alicyclobacillus pomorum]
MDRDEISLRIGERLKQLRQRRSLSLDALAQLTGVSKPMLAQIERGASNPTVATLWKVAAGLNVPFTAFVADHQTARLVRAHEQTAFYEDNGRFQVFSTYASPDGQVELFRLTLLPGASRDAEAHPTGVTESLTVTRGCLLVRVSGVDYCLNKGDALHFQADVTHSYRNAGTETCEANMAIFYAVP